MILCLACRVRSYAGIEWQAALMKSFFGVFLGRLWCWYVAPPFLPFPLWLAFLLLWAAAGLLFCCCGLLLACFFIAVDCFCLAFYCCGLFHCLYSLWISMNFYGFPKGVVWLTIEIA